MQQLSVALPEELLEMLRDTARQNATSEETVVVEALEGYLVLQDEHLAEIRQGMVEADAGIFVEHEEVGKILQVRHTV